MNAASPAREPVRRDTDAFGDGIAQALPPANALERMLVTQLEQSWERLQRAYDAERRYCQGRDIVQIVTTKLAEFKAITRYVTDCERAWRYALLHLEKVQRNRQRQPPKAEQKVDGTRKAPPPVSEPTPQPEPMPQPVAQAARE